MTTTEISTRKTGNTMPALAMSESELLSVLSSSLYPGAKIDSIKLVVSYCKAAQLDPMQKPVHIVPMWDKNAQGMRDVIMPGVGLYRTQAARSGQLAGISEPEFGPDVTTTIGGAGVTYPEWCKVTVKRLVNGHVAEFTACERWRENYAVAGGKEKSIAPNAMWSKRPYAQLAKCAQAQALRTAFPEMTGAAPTADEMEGKTFDADITVIDGNGGETRKEPQANPPYDAAAFDVNFPKWEKLIVSGKKTAADIIAAIETKNTLTREQRDDINCIVEPTQDPQQ